MTTSERLPALRTAVQVARTAQRSYEVAVLGAQWVRTVDSLCDLVDAGFVSLDAVNPRLGIVNARQALTQEQRDTLKRLTVATEAAESALAAAGGGILAT